MPMESFLTLLALALGAIACVAVFAYREGRADGILIGRDEMALVWEVRKARAIADEQDYRRSVETDAAIREAERLANVRQARGNRSW